MHVRVATTCCCGVLCNINKGTRPPASASASATCAIRRRWPPRSWTSKKYSDRLWCSTFWPASGRQGGRCSTLECSLCTGCPCRTAVGSRCCPPRILQAQRRIFIYFINYSIYYNNKREDARMYIFAGTTTDFIYFNYSNITTNERTRCALLPPTHPPRQRSDDKTRAG
jgi:hypothetical protein